MASDKKRGDHSNTTEKTGAEKLAGTGWYWDSRCDEGGEGSGNENKRSYEERDNWDEERAMEKIRD